MGELNEVKQAGEKVALNALLAEDNEINAEIAKLQLEAMGFAVTWVENGARAVESFGESEPGFYSLIIMDIMMPVMDGIQATHIIRNLERNDAKSVPIVAISANTYPEDREMSEKNGVSCFITKPYSRKEFEKTVMTLVGEIK